MDPGDPGDPGGSIRERTIAENSLVVLLQGLVGHVTSVELRDESVAFGRVVGVDAFMNVRLADVELRRRGAAARLQQLFVAGRSVRYVRLPDGLDVRRTVQNQLDRIHRVRNHASHGGGRREFCKAAK